MMAGSESDQGTGTTSCDAGDTGPSHVREEDDPDWGAYDGSLATCTTSVPGGTSGDTTESTMAVAVRSRTWTTWKVAMSSLTRIVPSENLAGRRRASNRSPG